MEAEHLGAKLVCEVDGWERPFDLGRAKIAWDVTASRVRQRTVTMSRKKRKT